MPSFFDKDIETPVSLRGSLYAIHRCMHCCGLLPLAPQEGANRSTPRLLLPMEQKAHVKELSMTTSVPLTVTSSLFREWWHRAKALSLVPDPNWFSQSTLLYSQTCLDACP